MRRLIVRAAIAIVVLIAVTAASVYALLRRSLPVLDGVVAVAGPFAPIDIVRDRDAIPHVFAASALDALFGLGYVHAQDRLWQMEFQRRIGHGRLSEVFGAATIPQDRFLRTVGFGRAARAAWASTPPWAKQRVDAYVAGVNAFIATHHGTALPPEFSLLRFEPEPWTGADVLVWVKMMAWDLSANWSFEILRDDLVHAVGIDGMTRLMPPYARDGLSIVRGNRNVTGSRVVFDREVTKTTPGPVTFRQSASGVVAAALSAGNPEVRDVLLGAVRGEALGSNNWVVDGTLTASGKPLLANDPHLGTRLPSTWYLAHISGGDLDVVGATLPGAPAVALGRNRFIAWGATNVAADVEDLYRERVDDRAKTAAFGGAQEPLTIVPETIRVKGGDAIHLDVRVTRHGPLVSDALNANTAALLRGPKRSTLEPLALRWTALDPVDSTLAAFLSLNQAHDWKEFTTALRDFVVPSQNFVYADVEGHIGYYAPGRIPIRASGDGSLPADGWSGAAEWTGWVPFDDLPHLFDPPSHRIVTANHRPEPADYPYVLGFEWPEPYRAERITTLLSEGRRFTPEDFARMQADTVSLHAKALLPLLLAHAHPDGEIDRRAVDALRAWNGDATADSAAAAIFDAWFYALAPALVGDELPPAVLDSYASRSSYITRYVTRALTTGGDPFCDDRTTPKTETCADAVTAALHEGVLSLTRRMGGDMGRWRWDVVHHAVFPHAGLDAVAALRPLLSRSVPNGGDWSTIDVGPVDAGALYEQHSVPGYREVIDLSAANASRFLNDVGQSGHPLSTHYDDFLADWRAVRHRPMRMDRAEVERGATGRLTLVPAPR